MCYDIVPEGLMPEMSMNMIRCDVVNHIQILHRLLPLIIGMVAVFVVFVFFFLWIPYFDYFLHFPHFHHHEVFVVI